jgi:hypothetical protein
MNNKEQYDIVEKYGLPRDIVSCPSCGDIYGTKNRKVCTSCEECSKCCECKFSTYVNFKNWIKQEY